MYHIATEDVYVVILPSKTLQILNFSTNAGQNGINDLYSFATKSQQDRLGFGRIIQISLQFVLQQKGCLAAFGGKQKCKKRFFKRRQQKA